VFPQNPVESTSIYMTRGLPMSLQACTIAVIDDDPRVVNRSLTYCPHLDTVLKPTNPQNNFRNPLHSPEPVA
jgi:hypothetical protein